MKEILRKIKSFFFNVIIKEKILKGKFIIEGDSIKFIKVKNFKNLTFYTFYTGEMKCYICHCGSSASFNLYEDEAMLFLKRLNDKKIMKKQYVELLKDLK